MLNLVEIYFSVLKQKLAEYEFYKFIADNIVLKGNEIVQTRSSFKLSELPVDYMVVYYPGKWEQLFRLKDGVYDFDYIVMFADTGTLNSLEGYDWYLKLGHKKLDEVYVNFDLLLTQIKFGFAPVKLDIL